MKTHRLVWSSLLVVVVLWTSLGWTQQPKPGGTLRLAMPGDMTFFNANQGPAPGYFTFWVWNNLFNSLLTMTPPPEWKVVPELATAWDVQDGGRRPEASTAWPPVPRAARRVDQPDDIRGALAWAAAQAQELERPVLVEIMIQRDANAAMGTSIDAIKEFEPIEDPATRLQLPALASLA